MRALGFASLIIGVAACATMFTAQDSPLDLFLRGAAIGEATVLGLMVAIGKLR